MPLLYAIPQPISIGGAQVTQGCGHVMHGCGQVAQGAAAA